MLEYYNNFLSNLAQTPKEYYNQLNQDLKIFKGNIDIIK